MKINIMLEMETHMVSILEINDINSSVSFRDTWYQIYDIMYLGILGMRLMVSTLETLAIISSVNFRDTCNNL